MKKHFFSIILAVLGIFYASIAVLVIEFVHLSEKKKYLDCVFLSGVFLSQVLFVTINYGEKMIKKIFLQLLIFLLISTMFVINYLA